MLLGLYAFIIAVWFFFLPARSRIHAYQIRVLRGTALQKAFDNRTISFKHLIGLLAHHWVFPVVLTIYLLFLVIQQTNVRGLAWTRRYFLFNETWLLIVTILSGLLSVLADEHTIDKRTVTRPSPFFGRLFVVLSLVLGLIGARIIRTQTLELGRISRLISAIAGCLLVLVGFLLLEEDEEGGE